MEPKIFLEINKKHLVSLMAGTKSCSVSNYHIMAEMKFPRHEMFGLIRFKFEIVLENNWCKGK